MDYILNDIICDRRDRGRSEQFYRILKYYQATKEPIYSKNEINNGSNALLKKLLYKEIDLEKRIYGKIKKWEKRHPIIGFIICTILLGILLNLITEIILGAILNMGLLC